MNKPITVFDLETTGKDATTCRIVEIYAQKVLPNISDEYTRKFAELKPTELHLFINPEIPCEKEAEEKHGYTAEFLADKPKMSEVVRLIWNFFQGSSVSGYNIDSYDVIVLACEFERYGLQFDIENLVTVDGFTLWKQLKPRTLEGFVKEYAPEALEDGGFHGAKFDVIAYSKALEGFLKANKIDDKSDEELHQMVKGEQKSLDSAGKLIYLPDGKLATTMDKWNYEKTGATLAEVFQKDLQYIKWCISEKSTVNASTKFHLRRLYNKYMEGK